MGRCPTNYTQGPVSLKPNGQRAIADYLDIETGRIDALISKKRRMIELLQQSVG